ncbi:MAG TPA: gamma-glutamylcyclotransferase [Stellaceae bacterium]|jgi:cation transport protein ChaC|nr:gamma-glutamylcyclotransferase [Stellaceae bacterium]
MSLLAAHPYISPLPIDPMPDWVKALRDPVWVFAYGSLMWNPEMAFAETRPAVLHGFHRRFCLYSRDYRGTPERPGLVLGLDRGGSCRGLARRLPPAALAAAVDRLWVREMAGKVYDMRAVTVATPQGSVAAYAFTVRRDNLDYAGRLGIERMAEIIALAAGGRGTGRDYLANTVRHLDELGIRDRMLRRLHDAVGRISAA